MAKNNPFGLFEPDMHKEVRQMPFENMCQTYLHIMQDVVWTYCRGWFEVRHYIYYHLLLPRQQQLELYKAIRDAMPGITVGHLRDWKDRKATYAFMHQLCSALHLIDNSELDEPMFAAAWALYLEWKRSYPSQE